MFAIVARRFAWHALSLVGALLVEVLFGADAARVLLVYAAHRLCR